MLLGIWKKHIVRPNVIDGETCARPLGSFVCRHDMGIPVPVWTQGVRVGSVGTALAQGEAVRAGGGRVLDGSEKVHGYVVARCSV